MGCVVPVISPGLAELTQHLRGGGWGSVNPVRLSPPLSQTVQSQLLSDVRLFSFPFALELLFHSPHRFQLVQPLPFCQNRA